MCDDIIASNRQAVKVAARKEVKMFDGLRHFSKIIVTGPQ